MSARRQFLSRCLRSMLLGALALTAIGAPAVQAAEQYYTQGIDCSGRRGSGNVDAAGNLYVACNMLGGYVRPHVQVWSAAGVRTQIINLPFYATDVAPSPRGEFLYLYNNATKRVQRADRGGTGAYTISTTWKPANYAPWPGGSYEPLGEFLATDAQGFLYVSSGTWTNAPSRIIKYAPDGSIVDEFGSWENSWNTGLFYWMVTGVAVTPDGKSVYVSEVGNNRVQRFDRGADGKYAYAWKIGNDPATDEDPRTGWCGEDVRAGRFSAPYDVGVDAANNLYVLNTSCVQVRKFAPDGTHLHTEQLTNAAGGYIHGMAVSGRGDVYLPEINKVMRPGVAPAPQPQPQPEPQWIADNYTGYATATARAPYTALNAWKWAATGWTHTTFPTGKRVWAQPFAAGWMWVWTDNAWYAMRTVDLAR